MRFALFLSVIVGLCSVDLHAQDSREGPVEELFLEVIIPERDTTRNAPARHRIAAHTLPTARAFINGEEVAVYQSGAFVGLVDLQPGENTVELRVEQEGNTLTERFVFVRPEPLPPTPRDRLYIEEAGRRPAEDRWLQAGEVLEVRFRATPGQQAAFYLRGIPNVWHPMRELPPEETGGVAGIYEGRYVIQPGDELDRQPVRFRIGHQIWRRRHAESPGRITVAPYDARRVVQLTGTRPFVHASLGTDRLGGAILGYMEEGMRLVVDGRRGDHWRVRLGEGQSGWLPVRFAELLPPRTPLPGTTITSISATGNEREDVVSVAVPERVAYLHRMGTDPSEIIVDLFQASANTNWITHHRSAEGIDRIWWEQPARDHYRLHIRLNHDQHWGYDVSYGDSPGLQIRIRRPPVFEPENPISGLTVVVDAGHGGSNLGAIGATGAREKDITLAVARRLEEILLHQGASVVMTREEDIDVAMGRRMEIVLDSRPDLLVSIHANSIGYATDPEAVRGTSTYYRYPAFKPLSEAVYSRLLELGLPEFGVVGSFNFSLNAPVQMPNVLVETAFISHPEEEILLLDPAFQQELAQKVALGLADFVRQYGASRADREEAEEEEAPEF